jgi:hypothetical protein
MLVNKDSEIENLGGQYFPDNQLLKLTLNTEFLIVRSWQMPGVGEVAEIYIDSDDITVPTEAWVRVSDIYPISQNIEEIPNRFEINNSGNVDFKETDISKFTISGNHTFSATRVRKSKIPSCYRDVKFELLRRSLVNRYPSGAAAWMGYNILRKQFGFKPVAFSKDLPNGTVCVSEGGRYRCSGRACGHIAIKIGSQQWYGAGTFVHPLLKGHSHLRCLKK